MKVLFALDFKDVITFLFECSQMSRAFYSIIRMDRKLRGCASDYIVNI